MQHNKAEQLFKKYQLGQCSAEEQAIIENYIIFEGITPSTLSEEEMQSELNDLSLRITSITRKKRKLWPLITVAASLLIFLSVGIILLVNNSNKDVSQNYSLINDVLPGNNAATLTLSNGKKVSISNYKNGLIGSEIDAGILKSNEGRITYNTGENRSASQAFNTLTTTNAQQYSVILGDGTIVWLNATSSLTYPVSFIGKDTRKVILIGEAYFEVTKNKTQPFIVESRGQKVEVLGTHFNVNSYTNEVNVKTTLLEGSVKVTTKIFGNDSQSIIIKPGQQSVVKDGKISVNIIETDDVVDWKNGNFNFNDEEIESVMRKLERWYNIDVEFETKKRNVRFGAEISKHRTLSQVLSLLTKTSGVNFKIEGRRVIVMD